MGSGLANTLHRNGQAWVADTPEGEATTEFTPANAYGVLDHRVCLKGRAPIDIPLRMIANGDGTDVVLTLFRQPHMDAAAFERDAERVRGDLTSLKRVLERG